MSELIISVSGLRGVVGQSLTPLVAARYVAAFESQAPPGPIVVARDGRPSGPMLRDALVSALVACGRPVLDAGIAATPTVGVLVRQTGAAGAVQISASHNPPPYNGIKLFGPDGRVLGAAAGAVVRQRYEEGRAQWKGHEGLGRVEAVDDPHAAHLAAVLATVDVEAIRRMAPRVLLDSNHGAGSLLGSRLLEALGASVHLVGGEPHGHFAHPPEPTAENLAEIGHQVREAGCAVGFCQDPDADRLALIDAQGRYLGEEYTVALCIDRLLRLRPGPVVINAATSSMSERLAVAAGVACYRSPVGEANVADWMIQQGAVYGGEGNGGPIDPQVGYVRDSFVGMAQVLDLMARTGQPLSALADALPRLAIHKATARVAPADLPSLLDRIAAAMADGQVDRQDGLRLAWPDRWLLVRGSNTEPIIRLIAEADSPDEAAELCRRAAALIPGG